MSILAAFLSDRQRHPTPPPDRVTPRRGTSSGGVAVADGPYITPHGMDDNVERTRAKVFDGRILRDRGPYLHVETTMPAGQSWVNWTKAGPVRAELHVSQRTYRVRQGSSATRYPVVDSPTTGRHTDVQAAASRTLGRYRATPQMTARRQGRLRPGQYHGQTYSQLTRIQGR